MEALPLHILSAFLFATGLAIVIIKRNAIVVLMGIELMLNASNVNLIVFNRMHPSTFDGQMFALFVIIVAVCETAVGLAIILRVYRFYKTSVPDHIQELKG
ncbi:NADH-quinone oxidoreductase subunit NuoK [Fulvivirgaceae bacterium PWU20]|uniref:NADH-quinone oxidoreductase subunit K n=1 Tax=Chryseosolibacter indicus TaxID=2782351 RepID=A0ABS5VPK9_9BACT|nr:NADH-quinone oxidoreductase subunit NuoK [Chryseosolibacter indicus]